MMMTFTFKLKTTLLLTGVVAIVSAACLAENVGADSYARDCKQDSDCLGILELSVVDGKCTQPCAAINKKDEDRYKSDIEEERHDCSSLAAAPECPAPACRENKCVVSGGAQVADAGSD